MCYRKTIIIHFATQNFNYKGKVANSPIFLHWIAWQWHLLLLVLDQLLVAIASGWWKLFPPSFISTAYVWKLSTLFPFYTLHENYLHPVLVLQLIRENCFHPISVLQLMCDNCFHPISVLHFVWKISSPSFGCTVYVWKLSPPHFSYTAYMSESLSHTSMVPTDIWKKLWYYFLSQQ